nr:L-aspartate oxidase [Streptomyces sp. HNM0575]
MGAAGSAPLRAPAPGWRIDADVVVVGSGVAGLTAALRCDAAGLRTVVVTKASLDDGSTRWAQGGIAAALGEGDSPAQHLDDTLVAGAGLCDEEAVHTLVTEGPAAVRRLIGTGARFDTDPASGEMELTREGGHHRRRIAHAGGDATGAEISRALLAAVREVHRGIDGGGGGGGNDGIGGYGGGLRTVENALVLDLLKTPGGAATGVTLHVMGEGQHDGVGAVHAPAVVLATGGMGQIFSATTNPPVSTGDGVALALRAGAEVSDLEFVQFHPTALYLGAGAEGQQPLISEAVRGEGAHLVDADGVRFMTGEHELAELAPRDIVAKAIMRRAAEQGAEPGTEHAYLDARHFGAAMWESRFPTILDACRSNGIDPVTQPIPVAPAAHYASGGVRTDLHGRTTVPGLYACGEVACTGVHGANRLASNSLLEGLVFAERIAETVARDADRRATAPEAPGATAPEATEPAAPTPDGPTADAAANARTDAATSPRPAPGTGTHTDTPADTPPDTPVTPLLPAEARPVIQRVMTSGAGVLRSAASLADAAARLEALPAATAHKPADPGVETWETANLHLVARVLVAAALRREETRGCHWREDRPHRDDASWSRHLVVGLHEAGRTLDVRTTRTTRFPPTTAPRPEPHGAPDRPEAPAEAPADPPPHTPTEKP